MKLKAVSGIMLMLLFIGILTLAFNIQPVNADGEHPRNYCEAWNVGFRGIIEPNNPFVLQQLHYLCPTIDEEHFTTNFLAVYTYSMLIPYDYDSDVYGVIDYWQTSEETISLGRGDCEDQAINLATLIEALYKETYGYIPFNLVWVVLGNVKTPGGEGGHGWVLVNEGALPKETIEEIKSVSISEAIIQAILGGIANIQDLGTQIRHEIETNLDLAALDSKNGQQLSLFYSGERYFEFEPTWNLPISEFYFKKYPYTEVWAIFNSQGYDLDPDFYPVEQPPYMGAEIKNIAFPNRVIVDSTCTVNITVQNYDCGILGADLVVILKDYGIEVARQNAYVPKYWSQIKTFVFTLLAIEPARIEQMSAELYWNNWGNWIFIDFKNFTIETISNKPELVPITSFTYPENACDGQLVVFNVLGQNFGPKSATSWTIEILIDNQPFDSVWVTNCNAFSGFQIQTKPWIATAGTHFLRVIVDATNVISEHNETNNEIVVPFVVRAIKALYIEEHLVTIESNATIAKTVVTENTLHFDASGLTGSTGYINVTFPNINTTEIKVFIDGDKLTPPPFPVIDTNGTHYFIYFEFTLSTHTIAIQFAPLEYTLTVYSSPSGVTFTVDGVSRTTPWSGTYSEGASVSLVMPETHTVGNAKYYWNQWSDGVTTRSRTVTMNTNITLTAQYTGPYYQLTVTSSPITGIPFTINGVSKTTPYTEWLLEGSYTLVMPQTHNGYVWSHWLEDGDTNRIKTITLQGTTWTAVYIPAPPPPSVGGKATPINIPRNKPELQIPWIWLTTIVIPLITTVVYVKKRKRNLK